LAIALKGVTSLSVLWYLIIAVIQMRTETRAEDADFTFASSIEPFIKSVSLVYLLNYLFFRPGLQCYTFCWIIQNSFFLFIPDKNQGYFKRTQKFYSSVWLKADDKFRILTFVQKDINHESFTSFLFNLPSQSSLVAAPELFYDYQ
jgi:hypothetical protein